VTLFGRISRLLFYPLLVLLPGEKALFLEKLTLFPNIAIDLVCLPRRRWPAVHYFDDYKVKRTHEGLVRPCSH